MFGGIIIHGDHIGKGLGFPTANLDIKKNDIKLSPGVYACFAWLNKKNYQSALAIQSTTWKVEVHLFDYNGEDFYGKYLEVEPVQKVSEMQEFVNEADLREKIREDVEKVRELLGDK